MVACHGGGFDFRLEVVAAVITFIFLSSSGQDGFSG